MCDVETLRLFVNERLSAAADDIFTFFIRALEQYHLPEPPTRRLCHLQHPDLFSACEDQISAEHQDRNSSLLQEEPELPLIKKEQEDEEQLHRPEEADWPLTTSPAAKCENDDGNHHKYLYAREIEAVASTSSQDMESVADEEDCGTSPLCGQSDSEAIDDFRTTQSTLNPNTAVRSPTLDLTKSHDNKTQNMKGQSWCLSVKLSQGPEFSLKSPVMRSPTVVEKPFSCTICDKGYSGKSDLKRHMRTHTGEKPFSCAICGKCFGGRTVLKRHIATHTGEKPFSCPVCGKRFNRNETMKRHMITHTGERPFSCMICGKCFGLNAHLKKHMRTHTSPSGQRTNLM